MGLQLPESANAIAHQAAGEMQEKSIFDIIRLLE
jgi:hypothetical protein